MKKYTNKILLGAIIIIAAIFVIGGTVDIQTAWHSGKIREFGVFPNDDPQEETYDPETPMDIDTIASDKMKNKDVNF